MLTPWKKSYDQPRQHIKKQRYYFANKGLSSQGYGFSSGHVWMRELDCEEISLNYNFGWTMLACGVAFTLHAIAYLIIEKWIPQTDMKESRLAHMFESGRLED